MQINVNSSPAPVAGVESTTKAVKQAVTQADSTAFSHVDELERSMRDQEDTRPTVVQKAAALVNQNQWPPSETMRRLANLLAISMDQSSQA